MSKVTFWTYTYISQTLQKCSYYSFPYNCSEICSTFNTKALKKVILKVVDRRSLRYVKAKKTDYLFCSICCQYVLVNVNGFVFALLLFQAIFRWSTEVALTSCIVGKLCPPPHPLLLLAIGDSFLDALMDSATYITSKVGSFSRTINS